MCFHVGLKTLKKLVTKTKAVDQAPPSPPTPPPKKAAITTKPPSSAPPAGLHAKKQVPYRGALFPLVPIGPGRYRPTVSRGKPLNKHLSLPAELILDPELNFLRSPSAEALAEREREKEREERERESAPPPPPVRPYSIALGREYMMFENLDMQRWSCPPDIQRRRG